MSTHKIAVIAGDGIGKEVVPEGLRCLDAAARKHNIAIQWDEFDWSCDYYLKHGAMMPEDWKAQIGGHGLRLMRHYLQPLRYRRSATPPAGRNCLLLEVALPAVPASG